MKKSFKTVIIGSGPTGLGAGYRLKELGDEDFVILERSGHPGGLASSFVDEKGYTWDIGGHVQFSHYRYFDELMLKAIPEQEWFWHERESWAWMNDCFVPYPVQNNIRYLPKEVVWKCVEGLIELHQSPRSEKPRNFAEWIQATFGTGLSDVFMRPYNQKVWAFPPEDMAYQWIGERVAVTDLKRVVRNVLLGLDDVSWGPNSRFMFPSRGGTGQIWKNVAALVGESKIHLNSEVIEINSETREVRTRSGEVYCYEKLLSTMPVDVLCGMLRPMIPARIHDQAQKLLHSSSNIVGLGLKGAPSEKLRTKCWMYFPESDCPFYRVTVFSNYSSNNVPDIRQNWSLMTETSESPKKPVERARLIEETIQGCLNTGLIESRDDVISTWEYRADYGYPTPSVDRDAILSEVLPYLDRIGVYSRGRFGAWKYEVSNQDHSLMQGVEWADFVKSGQPEVTVFHPEIVNAGKR